MKLPSEWPVVVKQGSVSVKIYRTSSKGYQEFKVSCYGCDGKRRLRTFANFGRAKRAAQEVAGTLSRGDAMNLSRITPLLPILLGHKNRTQTQLTMHDKTTSSLT